MLSHKLIKLQLSPKWQAGASCVFSVTSYFWCSWICESSQSGVAQLGEWGDSDLGLVSVCDITFCCGKKALSQPADCAHCLPLADFTDCASEVWDLQKHINCMRHRCQHTDCLSFHSQWEKFSHILQRGQFGGKIFPACCDFTVCLYLVTHTAHVSFAQDATIWFPSFYLY